MENIDKFESNQSEKEPITKELIEGKLREWERYNYDNYLSEEEIEINFNWVMNLMENRFDEVFSLDEQYFSRMLDVMYHQIKVEGSPLMLKFNAAYKRYPQLIQSYLDRKKK